VVEVEPGLQPTPPRALLTRRHAGRLPPPQKREDLGADWQPKWFAAAPDMQVLPGEECPATVPLWAWNGSYEQVKQVAPVPAAAEDWQATVCGEGFVPWQFRSNPVQKQGSSSRASSKSPTRSPKLRLGKKASKKDKEAAAAAAAQDAAAASSSR
jgi:hypothetical protein